MKTSLLSTAVLASSLLVGHVSTASAAPLNLTHSFVSSTTDVAAGVITTLPVPGSSTYGHSFAGPTTTIPGSPGAGFGFYDDIVFTISSASANSINSTIDFSGLLQINNLQVRLYNAAGNTFPVLTAPVVPSIDFWSSPVSYGPTTGTVAVLPVTTLGAGTYVLEVRGNVVGSFGGSYSGVLNVAPVPVPAAAWMFGSGLMGLVAVGRRRR